MVGVPAVRGLRCLWRTDPLRLAYTGRGGRASGGSTRCRPHDRRASDRRHDRRQDRRSVLISSHGTEWPERSEEHTSELQSLMSISYAVFCLKKKKQKKES